MQPTLINETTPDISGYTVEFGRIVPGSDQLMSVVSLDVENSTTEVIIPRSDITENADYRFSVFAINTVGRSESASRVDTSEKQIHLL